VLKEMGKSGTALFFVLGPNVVPDVDGYQRDGVIFMEDDV
jgi:hypothetical protein